MLECQVSLTVSDYLRIRIGVGAVLFQILKWVEPHCVVEVVLQVLVVLIQQLGLQMKPRRW